MENIYVIIFSFLLNYLDEFSIERIKSFTYEIYNIIADYINSNEIGNKTFIFNFNK